MTQSTPTARPGRPGRPTSTACSPADGAAVAVDGPAGLRIAFQPDDVRSGLGRLVLTVIELVRELLERQAMRRIEAGSLTEPEIERLGTTFLKLSEQMETLKAAFGLEGQELNLDLGPLGKLLDTGLRIGRRSRRLHRRREASRPCIFPLPDRGMAMSPTQTAMPSARAREEIRCAFCHGRGTDPFNVLSDRSVCSSCGGRGTLT